MKTKEINVPFIEGIHTADLEQLDRIMEVHAAKGFINEMNWIEYPYTPLVGFSIARSRTHLVIMYNVRGSDLRAVALEDNGPVWEDSCCEFFVSDPADGTYYNFEMNCIGTLLAAKRRSRTDADMFTEEMLSRIIRHSSLERKTYDESNEIHTWSTALCIPFDLIGADASSLPEVMNVNFYKCGDLTAHPHFLSWNRIDVPSPDFHRPEFFGRLTFND